MSNRIRSQDFDIEHRLAEHGYAHIDRGFIGNDQGDICVSRRAFVESCKNLPPDRHCDKGERNRIFGNFYLLPWAGLLESNPPVVDNDSRTFVARYLQSAVINKEHDGRLRSFSPLTETQRTNLFLRSTIFKTFEVLPWTFDGGVIVGVHVVQLVARHGEPGVSSPNALHRDGEPFTFGFLLDRVQVDGGENFIAAPELANRHPDVVPNSEILARFTLTDQFQGFVVDDRRVSHYVSPVSVSKEAYVGWRTILLIDFSPAVPGVS